MTWTTPADIKLQTLKLWNRGLLPASLINSRQIFPRCLTLKSPSSRDISERFSDVKKWIAQLTEAAGLYRIEWNQINHRIIGANQIPGQIWIDTRENALKLIGKRREADELIRLAALIAQRQPKLLSWLEKRPLKALKLLEDWPRLLDITAWLLTHPRPNIYPRQIALPGIHTKFIEENRGVLSELLDITLPPQAIDPAHSGIVGFCRRYGLLDKPARIRFRLLDSKLQFLPSPAKDITLTQTAFAALNIPVKTVFITENEINFLAFPQVPEALVIFGAGYGFDALATASWLHSKTIRYWGDIDTHGLAILNQFRTRFPHADSFLMDERTLLAHRSFWVTEPRPETVPLKQLTTEESALYNKLRQNYWGVSVRLEQERIGYNHVLKSAESGD